MGAGTYVDGMTKENLTQEVTFTMKPKGWQGLLYAKSQRKSISSRRNSKDKDPTVGKSFRRLRK